MCRSKSFNFYQASIHFVPQNIHPMIRIPLTCFVVFLSLGSVLGAADKPNVVIVITDDQGYGDLSCHGNPIVKTPNIDKLFSQSVRLTDYHVAPTCSPTRCAFLTGHWTNRTGVWHTIMGRSMLREDEVTMGQVFKDAGYATGMFGKWHLGDNYPYRPEDRGFTEVMRHGGGGVGQTPDYWDNAYFDGSYWHNGKPTPVKGFCTDVFSTTRSSSSRIQKRRGNRSWLTCRRTRPTGQCILLKSTPLRIKIRTRDWPIFMG
jgi:arylsulfatase A-like enzyme